MAAQGSLLTGVPEALRHDGNKQASTDTSSVRLSLSVQVNPIFFKAISHPYSCAFPLDTFKVRRTNLFHSWYKLLRDVGSDSLVFKLQLGVMLWLKRLQDSDNFTVLPRAAALLLVSEVKPAENGTKCPHLEKGVTLWNHRSTRAPFKTLGTIPLPQTGPIYVGLHLHCLIQGGRKPQKRSSVSLKRGPSSLASGERGSGK